ncbi:MAG: hypothetical protein OHK0017_06830 [Patescibacteria group bacterium]
MSFQIQTEIPGFTFIGRVLLPEQLLNQNLDQYFKKIEGQGTNSEFSNHLQKVVQVSRYIDLCKSQQIENITDVASIQKDIKLLQHYVNSVTSLIACIDREGDEILNWLNQSDSENGSENVFGLKFIKDFLRNPANHLSEIDNICDQLGNYSSYRTENLEFLYSVSSGQLYKELQRLQVIAETLNPTIYSKLNVIEKLLNRFTPNLNQYILLKILTHDAINNPTYNVYNLPFKVSDLRQCYEDARLSMPTTFRKIFWFLMVVLHEQYVVDIDEGKKAFELKIERNERCFQVVSSLLKIWQSLNILKNALGRSKEGELSQVESIKLANTMTVFNQLLAGLINSLNRQDNIKFISDLNTAITSIINNMFPHNSFWENEVKELNLAFAILQESLLDNVFDETMKDSKYSNLVKQLVKFV